MKTEEALLILNISSDNPSITKIKNAYRILAKKYHPDSSGRKEHIRFVLVQEAYELLKEIFKNNTFIEPDEEEIEDEPTQPIQSKNPDEIFINDKLSILENIFKNNSDYKLFAKELGELNYFLKVSGHETNTKKVLLPLFENLLIVCQKALDQFEDLNNIQSFINTIKTIFPDSTFIERLNKYEDLINYREEINKVIESLENSDYSDIDKMTTCHREAKYYIKINDIKTAVRFTRLAHQFQKKVYRP